MAKLTVDELFDETMRLSDVLELSDRLVWMWRMTSYRMRCADGTCNLQEPTPDPTELILNFRDALLRDLGHGSGNYAAVRFAELLAIQTMKRSDNIELQAPEHMWVASEFAEARCSCGWVWLEDEPDTAFSAWEEHASDGLELLPWQEAWLNEFNTQP